MKAIKYQKSCHTLANFLFNRFRFWGSRKLARFINKVILPPLDKRLVSSTIFNFSLYMHPENGRELYYLGFYEMGTLNVIKNCLKKNDVFIDVGASIGLMSFYASKLIGTNGLVLSFEPTKQSFQDLSDSMQLNLSTNIKAFNIGLGAESKQIPIYLDRPCPSMVKNNNYNKDDNYELATIKKLDTVLYEININKVTMLKIDVEGFEIEVLKGAHSLLSSTEAPIICFEYIKILSDRYDETKSAISYIHSINATYKFYQLTKTSSTISKLKLITNEKKIRDNDNIFALTDKHLKELKTEFFI